MELIPGESNLYRIGTLEDGSQAAGTISPVRNCLFLVPQNTTAVEIGSYSAPSGPTTCMPDSWAATNNNPPGSFDYTQYIAQCPNNVKGFIDDGALIELPGGLKYCSAFPAAGCTTPDYIADLNNYRPRSAGFMKQNLGPPSGTQLSSLPVTSDGYITNFVVTFRAKQQYDGGFQAWIVLRVTTTPPCDPAVDPDCPDPPTPPVVGLSCPTYSSYPSVKVDLPDQSPTEQGQPSGYYSGSYTEVDRYDKTMVTSVDDISSGGDDVAINHNNDGYEVTYLNYTPYVERYPYDPNQASVTYTSHWRERTWGQGAVAQEPVDANGDGDYNDAGDDPNTYYSWSAGSWSDKSKSHTVEADEMPPCFNRLYDTSANFSTAQWRRGGTTEFENPNHAYFAVDMSVNYEPHPTPGIKELRNPNRLVNVPSSTRFVVYKADGSTSTLSAYTGCTNALTSGSFSTPPAHQADFSANKTWTADECGEASMPPLEAGDYACLEVTLSRSSGQMNHAGVIDIGEPTTSQTLPNPLGGARSIGSPGCTQKIVNRPYFTVSKGDVLAGSCNAGSGAIIQSWYASGRGAGTTLAAYALGTINEFSSAATRSSAPTPVNGLSFANLTTYGGGWAADPPCHDTFFAATSGAFAGGSLDGLNGTIGATGTVEISGGTINTGQKLTLVVEGDVRINGNIQLNAGNTYNSVADIPGVRIVARNIYIDPLVTNVDAVLVAESDGAGAGGTIMTCTLPAANAQPSDRQAAQPVPAEPESCQRKLTIRGALLASKIFFLRTNGSLRSGGGGDYSYGGTGNIAEHIIFSPSSWLVDQLRSPSGESPYKAYTNMPPIL